jgi:hypothetical protein
MQSALFVLRGPCRRDRGSSSLMVMQTRPSVISCTRGMQSFPCRRLRRPTSFSASQMPEAKSDEMSRRPWTIYCQKVATPRIDRPLRAGPQRRCADEPKRRRSGGMDRRYSLVDPRPGSMTLSHRRSRSTRRKLKALQAGIAWLRCRPDATPRLCFRWRIGYGRIAYGSGGYNRHPSLPHQTHRAA